MAPLETEEIGRAWTEYLNYLQERVNELKSLFFFRIDETDEKNLQRITACLRESNETLNKAENLLHNLKVYVQSEQEAQEEGQILKDLIESFDSKVKTMLKQLPEGDQSYVGNCIKDTTYSYGTGTQESEMLPQNQKQQTSEKKRVSSAHSPSNNISSITVGKVSADELSQVPQYLKGRLTTEKVNQIIDKLDSLFREKYTLLSKPLRTLSSAEIDRVTDYRNQEVDQVANSYFLSDQDLKNCSCLKFDTTTKNTLHVLRHLGRLKENCGALAAEEEKFRRAESSVIFFGCWSRYGSPSRSAHPARFSPDDKFSRQRVTIKKRFGLLLTQQPENPL